MLQIEYTGGKYLILIEKKIDISAFQATFKHPFKNFIASIAQKRSSFEWFRDVHSLNY